MKSKFYFAANY